MGNSQLTSLLARIGDAFATLSNSDITVLESIVQLQYFGEKLAAGTTAPDDMNPLQQINNNTNDLLNTRMQWSDQTDQLLHDLQEFGIEFSVDPGDPDLNTNKEQLNNKRSDAIRLREQMRGTREQLPELNQLLVGIRRDLRGDEIDLRNIHILCCDRVLMLASSAEASVIKLLANIDHFLSLYDLLNDPRFMVGSKTDHVPFALLPVRTETRFMVIKHIRNNRVFTSVFDSFRNDQDFAKIVDLDRAEAVSKDFRGPGKGLELQPAPVQELVPDGHELWLRIYPDDLEVDAHEPLLTQNELDATFIYWQEIWKAGNDSNLELGAWRVLAGAFGAERAAYISKQTIPTNGQFKPLTPVPTLSTFPSLPSPTLKTSAWTSAACSNVMPDCFVVRLYDFTNPSSYREVIGSPVPSPLPLGFDPSGNYTNYMNPSGTGLNMPQEIRWLTDFEEAERVGMGIRIPLQNNEQQQGFSRILVLGLKLSSDMVQSSNLLENLFNSHHYKTGLALVPQGTPTNNTNDDKSGYASYDPGKEISFANERSASLFTSTTDHYEKADGQRLADALGIPDTVFKNVAHSDAYDVKESIAMSRALWSATLGYYTKNLLQPATLPGDVANTRTFFTNYVHGRGLIPAFRVKNQPYGVLPTTVYSRWKYSDDSIFEANLHKKVLMPLDAQWELLSQGVSHITGQSGDPSTLLVDILGLHPASLSFYQRITGGTNLMWNLKSFLLAAGQASGGINYYDSNVLNDINQFYSNVLGFNYLSVPRILEMTFMADHRLLNGPVVDVPPLSETNLIQNIKDTNYNYIAWLRLSPLKNIRNEDFTNIGGAPRMAPPQALLYLLLRQAFFLEHLDTAHCFLTSNNLVTQDAWFNHELIRVSRNGAGEPTISPEQTDLLFKVVKSEVLRENEVQIRDIMRNLDTNPDYQASGLTPEQYEQYLWDNAAPHIENDTTKRYGTRLENYVDVKQSQWDYLKNPFNPLTEGIPMEDYIFDQTPTSGPCVQQLNEVKNALGLLETLPTARLERCLAEHLDTCSYRLDAWMNGLVCQRLDQQRDTTQKAIHLGAYSILERVYPSDFPSISVVNLDDLDTSSTWQKTAARLTAKKELIVAGPGESPTNPGSPYFTQIGAQYQPSTFIYLGEDRSTLLVEDRLTGAIVSPPRENPANEGFILSPSLAHAVTAAILRAGYVASKTTAPAGSNPLAVDISSERVRTALYYIEGIRNGQTLGALLGYQFERALHDAYAGLTGQQPLDGYLFDIRAKFPLIAETVIATTGGSNSDAQARTVTDGLKLIQAFRTSPGSWYSGITIASGDLSTIENAIRDIDGAMDAVGDLLLSEAVYQVARGNFNRSGAVLSALGAGSHIPQPEIIQTPRQNHVLTHRCAIQLQPVASASSGWTGTGPRALTEPALNAWLATKLPNPASIKVHVSYTGSSSTAFVKISDLGLQPLDFIALFSVSGNNNQQDASELSKRITYRVIQSVNNGTDFPVNIDYRNNAGFSTTECTIFQLLPLLRSLVQLIGKSRALTAEDFLLPNEASGIVSTVPGGAISSSLFARISNANTALGTVVTALNSAIATPTVSSLRTALLNASLFGANNAVPDSFASTSADTLLALTAQAKVVSTELSNRQTAATAHLGTPYTSLTTETARVKKLGEIAQDIYGKGFKVFPEFTLYNFALVGTSQAGILADAGTYAVDEWMQGIARVRPQMGNYRKQMLLSETATATPSTTTNFTQQRVVQLPVGPGGNDRWVGMEITSGYEITGDTLSMVIENTALPANSGTVLSGMLVDEWTEHIPVKDVTTGIALHYDQPSNEAPQSILLAVTPEIKGYWTWADLMDTLNETISMAMKRGVEPDMITGSSNLLSQVLPALVLPMTGGTDTSPSLDLARNIIVSDPGFNGPIDTSLYTLAPQNPNDLSIPNNQN